MRTLLLKCLVVLLSLALASGNAHAALSVDEAAHSGPCPEEHAHHHHDAAPADHATHQHGTDHRDSDHHDKACACCCECLGCTTAVDLVPSLSVMPREHGVNVRFERRTAFHSGQALDPELDPPRPGALI